MTEATTQANIEDSEELLRETLSLPCGALDLLRPVDGVELPDEGEIQWAPLAPYWAVLWRSGVALAHHVCERPLEGRRVVELGCGLGVPSLVAARAGATVLATDASEAALELLGINASANGVRLETARVDWTAPSVLVDRSPFDLVLAADVLYEKPSVGALLSLLPRLGDEVWLADPGRAVAEEFFARAETDWAVETSARGVVSIRRLRRRAARHSEPDRPRAPR